MNESLLEVRTLRIKAPVATWALMAMWVGLVAPAAAQTDALHVAPSGKVGIGTTSPSEALHILGTGPAHAILKLQAGPGLPRIIFDNGDSAAKWLFDVSDNQDFRISVNGSGVQEFLMEENGNLTIRGQLVTQGPQCSSGTPCDDLFLLGEQLESIEEHSAQMWEAGYLPSVGPTIPDQPLNLSERTGRILNELEKAHIFIEQLNQRLQEKEAQIDQIRAVTEELSDRLARLEG